MVGPVGFEPTTPPNKHGHFLNPTHKYAHNAEVVADAALGEVVRSWSGLSSEIRTAVLAIIKAADIRKGGAHD